MTKKIKRKTKILVSWQRYDWNDVMVTSKFPEMISIALELNKQNLDLEFVPIATLIHFLQAEKLFFKYDDVIQRHGLLLRFGKWVFRDFERISPQEQ